MNTKNLKTKTEYKSTRIISILAQNFSEKMNLSRIKFFGLFLCALCKVQSVSFEKLSTAFESEARRESSLRRIQRFMAEYVLDSDLIARFIFKLLPHQPPDITRIYFVNINITLIFAKIFMLWNIIFISIRQ